jgi:hypothetical protein
MRGYHWGTVFIVEWDLTKINELENPRLCFEACLLAQSCLITIDDQDRQYL